MAYDTHEELQSLGIGRKIKTLREERGYSMEEFAANIKVTPVLLSQIESEVVPPTVATLLNISKILNVGIDFFFKQETFEDAIELTRPDERLKIKKSSDSESARLNYGYEALAYRLRGKKMEPFMVEFDVKTDKEPVLLSHEGEEFLYCLEGEIEFKSPQKTIRLCPGDSLYYFANVPHALVSVGEGVPKAIVVLLPEC